MKRIVGVNIVVSLILIFFLKSSAESDKAWLELYCEKYDNSPVVDIIKDYDKDLYLATPSKFYKIREDFTLEEIKIDSKFTNKKILKIYPSRKKSIYVLFEAENNECIVTEYYNSKCIELGQLEMNHKVFFEDSKNRLWSTDYKSNILLFKDTKWETIKYNSGFLKTQNVHWPEESYDKKSFNPIIFLEDNKGRIWIYSSVIGGRINFEEAIDIRDAYKNISLNEDWNYKLGSGNFEGGYLNPVITKDREVFYSNYSNTIYYFDGIKWFEYKIKSIFGEGFFLEYPLFINDEGYIVANTHSNNGEKKVIFLKMEDAKSLKDIFITNTLKKNQI